jgi:hypothetical protein
MLFILYYEKDLCHVDFLRVYLILGSNFTPYAKGGEFFSLGETAEMTRYQAVLTDILLLIDTHKDSDAL